jgi:DNA-binding Lrp family transcriptional regulator
VDQIDRQIVHCLQRDGRASFRRIAEVLAVSEQTVARRFRSLQGAGVLRVLVLPDARAVGQQIWFVRILCRPGAADALADAVAARDDVSWVAITAGGGEVVCATSTDPGAAHGSVLLDRLPRTNQVLSFTAFSVLHMYTGGEAEWAALDDPLSDTQIALLLDGAAPAGSRPPTPGVIRDKDAPLFAALEKDGRAGVVELAREIGWPQSRVSARLEELIGSGVARVDLDVVPEPFGFHVVAYLWLTVAPADLDATGRALSLHPETSFAAAVTGVANLLTAVTCRDADALYTYVSAKVGALPAVRQAEIVPVLRRVKQAGTRVRNGRLVLS